MYYIYFVKPEPDSKGIKVGQTFSLAERWGRFRTTMFNPKLLGLIKCESKNEMKKLEQAIKYDYLSDCFFEREWLYDNKKIRSYIELNCNVDAEIELQNAIKIRNEKARDRYQHPEDRKKINESKRKSYKKRCENQQYKRKLSKESNERNKKRRADDPEYRNRTNKQSLEYYHRKKQCPIFREKQRKASQKRRNAAKNKP